MTIKRVVLAFLTVLAIALIGQDLLASWSQPQFQSRLELYQTNLVLQATEWQGDDPGLVSVRQGIIGSEPVKGATKQYEELRQSAQKNLERTQMLLVSPTADPSLKASLPKLERLLAELDLRLGVLQVQQRQGATAQKTWAGVIQETDGKASLEPLSQTAGVLAGLWSDPPRLVPDAEQALKKNLDSWFRYRSLAQLYQLQQRQESLTELQAAQQQTAERALTNLAIVGGIPTISCFIGIGILLFLGGQWVVRRKQSLLAPEGIAPWTVPWDGEIVWQVLIFGFFLVGQILLPLALGFLQQASGFNPAGLGERARAFYILANYLLLAAGGLVVLYVSVRAFLPLPEGWFQVKLRGKWLLWGLGGYFAALPLVILISLLNQQIWQGQGGSNPILPIALEGKDNGALILFFVTAAIAAPLFEEILFRGFLLPSLTRYMPVWGAITLSSFIFALAHLSLSEVLPLMVLGMVLGFVYSRSRNLLSSMLLHSLWNSGTLLSLFVLGSSSQ
ncbi:CPBP family intramembrane glutamic endopeptidase [Stenomitos frigidus]|uniref:CPBP family intramembrane metalloprotease domain-containing protein n=1 Tax=Stenomitos frigidus ULC18 TaxID=2107698 RepID=A0A2T1E9E3_9CYAN|nr:type II CAAX endopeptidase family protein [Stenomitos frigidus]PSB29333.1 CPBP family intramembrane metalloprotease domain-containing protein [Stenomitos frigidus ULC18]